MLFRSDQAISLGLAHGGVVVVAFNPDSPGQAAGLHRGDILTFCDGASVKSSQDLLAHIASSRPGTTIKVTGLRGRTTFEGTIPVRQRPPEILKESAP